MPLSHHLSRTAILLVLSATILSICTGLRQSFGLFLMPMAVLGISASAYSSAMALQSIVWGVSGPFIGMFADRYGSRSVLVVMALTFAAGLMVMSSAGGVAGLGLGGGFLCGLGIAGTGVGVVMGAVSRAVPPERRTRAVGAVAAAGSLGTLFMAPLGQWLVDGLGWRSALVVFAGIAGLMVPLGLAVVDPGSRHRTAVATNVDDKKPLGWVLREAATHPGYLAMTAAYFACGFQLMFITVHLPSYLAFCGLSPSLGGTAIGLIGLCNAVGTYATGLLGARYSPKRLLALIYLLRTLAIIAFIILPISPVSTLMFAAALGFMWLSVVPLVTVLVGKVFGVKHFSTLFGFVFLSHQIGSVCGTLLGGITFDLTGSYTTAWIGLIGVGLLAFALQWRMDDRTAAERAFLPALAGASFDPFVVSASKRPSST